MERTHEEPTNTRACDARARAKHSAIGKVGMKGGSEYESYGMDCEQFLKPAIQAGALLS